LANNATNGRSLIENLENWKRSRFPRLFAGKNTDAPNELEARKAAARAKNATLESEFRKLVEGQAETLYLIAGEDAIKANELQSWNIAQLYEMQNTQHKLLAERIKAQKEAQLKGKR
jgi:hypothetical protein